MHLKHLSLLNFKNCTEGSIAFSQRINCLLGDNGEGKTNVLDAIHYLSFCKSYFNPVDSQNIKHDEAFFVLQGVFDDEGEESEVYCGQKRGQKKSFKRNKKEYSRLSDHIGMYPLVMISPSDSDLINEGSEARRRFLDSIISQYDKSYLAHLIDYNKVLVHRNSLLKQFSEKHFFSQEQLDLWDFRLIESGDYIFKARQDFLEGFAGAFARYFGWISGGKEKPGIRLKSDLLEMDMKEILEKSLSKDRLLTYTQSGIHRDDLVFSLDDHIIKKFGSQGQQKSYLIALKLAQYDYISGLRSCKPVLLLDDIFDKLDDKRVKRLIELVTGESFGQVFISDTNPEKLPGLLAELKVPNKVFNVLNGVVKER